MPKNILQDTKSVHFIGIGGIGISAIARMMLLEEKKVSGSDNSDSEIIQDLIKAGAKIGIEHRAENILPDCDLIIYTIAITADNPEFIEGQKRGIKMITYPQALHEISKDKFTIAVSGTHGKTTTTAMIAKIMLDAGLDPTVIVGSLLQGYKSNFIAGKSKYFIVEACEYRRSFLNIEPTVLAITNIDNDHLDYYKNIADIQSAFKEMAEKLPAEGFLIANLSDSLIKPVVSGIRAKKIDYLKNFDPHLILRVPGDHNRKDAAVALSVAEILGLDLNKAKESLCNFAGTWRRFEFKGETKTGALVYDDYGHHPTEVNATLKGARELFPDKKIVVVFQPHLFSRTKLLLEDFAVAFSQANEILLAPIFPAREPFDVTISSSILAEKIKLHNQKAQSFASFTDIANYLFHNLKKGDVLITMGAGEQYKIGENLL